MRIDPSHRPWAIITLLLTAGSAFEYHMYAKSAVGGPNGSSAVGLGFGIAATVCMAFTGALGLRRRFRSLRIGSARTWLRGHLWVGFITLPLVLFHAGFRNGGPLTRVILYLLYAVWISGIFGLILQQFLPTALKMKVPNERLLSQIGIAIENLRTEAATLAGTTGRISDFYQLTIQPFLIAPPSPAGMVTLRNTCAETRTKLDPTHLAKFDRLETICVEYQGLTSERRLLWWMHSWLLIHVPLSMALLLLTAVHIIMALRFMF